MEKGKTNFWKILLKLVLSAAALYIVFRNIDGEQLKTLLLRTNPVWLVAGVILYNVSKVISSVRLNYYFRDIGVMMTEKQNLTLYYMGMFYNLFTPGGIGGDGYKVYALNKTSGTNVKDLVRAVLLDRLSGMIALVILSFIFWWMAATDEWYRNYLILGIPLSFAGFFLAPYIFGKVFQNSTWKTIGLSFLVQGVQVLCAWTLLSALGIFDLLPAYVTVFLVSSVVAVLPISIGGIGIRELVFITAAGFAPIEKDAAVAFSLLFFLVTALSSLPGGLLDRK